MSETFTTRLEWTGHVKPSRDPATFSRDLEVSIGPTEVPMTSAPKFRGDPNRVNPEQMFVAALSACHALTFLAFAARAGVRVADYDDEAEGTLEMSEGKMRMTVVTLHPHIVLENPHDGVRVQELLAKAHDDCFIGNSVSTLVRVEPHIAGALAA